MEKYKNLLPVYLKGLVSGKYSLAQAAGATGYSTRWLSHLKQEYLRVGFSCLDHKNKNRAPVNKIQKDIREKIARIYASKYKDVNFAFFRACLEEFEGIKVSLPTLFSILGDYGIRSPESRRRKKKLKIHRPRLRRENFGDLIQIDGTPYSWFYKSGDNKRYCMQGAIDDATGKITGLYITEFECLYGYLEILRQTCNSYGVPREIYSDRAAIFCVTPRNKKNLTAWEELAGIHDKRTQWQRILSDLSIRQILAWSPQAKGRVERMWQTVQGQLPQWFFLRGIKTVEQANKALPEYIRWFNSQFSVEPAAADSFFLEPPENLDDILCCQIDRTTDKSGGFLFHSYRFVVQAPAVSYKKFKLCISERGIFARIDGRYWPVQLLDHLTCGAGETMPQVLADIIYRYLYAFGKEISA